jgi:hypothetical protein
MPLYSERGTPTDSSLQSPAFGTTRSQGLDRYLGFSFVNNDESCLSDKEWLSDKHTPIDETEEFETMTELKIRTNSDSKSELPIRSSQFRLEVRIPKDV